MKTVLFFPKFCGFWFKSLDSVLKLYFIIIIIIITTIKKHV